MYLNRLKRLNLIPNFWCSEEYFKRAGWYQYSNLYGLLRNIGKDHEEKDRGIFQILDVEGFDMLPPLSPQGIERNAPYWAGFGLDEDTGKVLDMNYIYNPQHFINMVGKQWSAFRKNIKKWASNNLGCQYRPIREDERHQMMTVFINWLESRSEEEEIYDDQTILSYIKGSDNCRGLFRGEELVGFTIHDNNWILINFRYCFSKQEPFLNEYLRYCFYTSPEILGADKFINDGGVLDSPRLKFFKDRLNPVVVYSIPTKEI